MLHKDTIEIRKRIITDSEFDNILFLLSELKNPIRVPVFNSEWAELNEDQKNKLRSQLRGNGDYEKSIVEFMKCLI